MTYGYARVSTKGQDKYGNGLEVQEIQLKENGADVIYYESFTGTKKSRPELNKLMSVLREGDTVVVAKLDRIARSTIDGLNIVEDLLNKGVAINILNMGKFDDSPAGKLMRTMFFAFAEFERDMIVERTQAGKAVKKASDPHYKEGRKATEYDVELFRKLKKEVDEGKISVTSAAEALRVSRAKWYRIVAEETEVA